MTTLIRWLVVANLKFARDLKDLNQEVILSQGEASPYAPSSISSIVMRALGEAQHRISELLAEGQTFHELQLCIRPVLGGESRPSFGLSTEAISALARMGATLDFDPY
jgi:hypothetical protein